MGLETASWLQVGGHNARTPRVGPFLNILACLLAAGFLGGCGSDSGRTSAAPGIVRTTEAGVSILSIQGLWSSAWPARNIARIDTLLPPGASDPALGMISAIALSEDGKLAVLDGMAKEVWIFNQRIGIWNRIAAEGEGPAELGSATGAWWAGDTLSVYDASRRRIVQFAEGHTPIGTGLPLPGTRDSAFRVVPYGNSSGFLGILSAYPDLAAEEGVQRPNLTVVWVPVLPEDARSPDTVGVWPGRAWAVRPLSNAPLPFGPDTHIHANHQGIVVSDGSGTEAFILNFDAQVMATVRWDARPEGARDRVSEFLGRSLGAVPEENRPAARVLLEGIPFPEILPFLGGALMGDEEIWLAKWFGSELEYRELNWPRTEWRAIGLGTNPTVEMVTFPEGVLPLSPLSRERVLTLLQDDLGRQGVGIAFIGDNDATPS